MRTKKRSRALLVLALASLGLAACGDNPSGPPAAVAPPQQPQFGYLALMTAG